VVSFGAGVPRRRTREHRPLDLDAVEVGDEAVVVPRPQNHVVQFGGIARDDERDADVAAWIAPVHRLAHVNAEEFLVTRAGLEPDAAAAADPGGVVERAAAPPGVVNRTGRYEHAFRCAHGNERDRLDCRRRRLGRTRVRAVQRVVDHAAAGGVDQAHLAAGLDVACLRHDLRRRHEPAVDPRAAPQQPLLELIDLTLETAVTGTLAGPLLVVAPLGFPNLIGHRIDRRVETLGAERALAKREPPVDVLLPKIGVLEEAVPPDVAEIVRAIAGAAPSLGVVVPAVGRIQRPVEIPQRSHLQLSAAILVQVRAQPKRIHVHRQHVQQVVIDERIHVDVPGVPAGRIGEVGSVERIFERIEVPANPRRLGGGDLRLLGVHVAQRSIPVGRVAPRGAEAAVAIVGPVDLQHVPAADGGFGVVPGLEPFDVDPVRAPLDLLHEDVEPDVVTGRNRLIVRIEVHLDESGPHRVPADLIAQFVHQRVVDQRAIETERRVEDPVRFGGHAEDRDVPVQVVLIPGLKPIGALGRPEGAAAAPLQAAATDVIGPVEHPRPAVVAPVDKGRTDRPERGADVLAAGVDDDDRQVGAEIGHIVRQRDVRLTDRGTGGLVRLVRTGHHLPRAHDRNRIRVPSRRHIGHLAVGRESNLRIRVGRVQFEQDIARERAARMREDRRLGNSHVPRAVGAARRGLREVLLLAAMDPVRQVGLLRGIAPHPADAVGRAVRVRHLQVGPDQSQVLALAGKREVGVIVTRIVPIGPVAGVVLLLHARSEDHQRLPRRQPDRRQRPHRQVIRIVRQVPAGQIDRPRAAVADLDPVRIHGPPGHLRRKRGLVDRHQFGNQQVRIRKPAVRAGQFGRLLPGDLNGPGRRASPDAGRAKVHRVRPRNQIGHHRAARAPVAAVEPPSRAGRHRLGRRQRHAKSARPVLQPLLRQPGEIGQRHAVAADQIGAAERIARATGTIQPLLGQERHIQEIDLAVTRQIPERTWRLHHRDDHRVTTLLVAFVPDLKLQGVDARLGERDHRIRLGLGAQKIGDRLAHRRPENLQVVRIDQAHAAWIVVDDGRMHLDDGIARPSPGDRPVGPGVDLGRQAPRRSPEELHLGNLHAVGPRRVADRCEQQLIMRVRGLVGERDRRLVLRESGPGRRLAEVHDVPTGNQRIRPIDARVGAAQLEGRRVALHRIVGGRQSQARDDGRSGRRRHLEPRRLRFPLEVQVFRVDVVVDRQRRRLNAGPVPIVGHAPDEIARARHVGPSAR